MSGDKTTESGLSSSFGGLSNATNSQGMPGFAHPDSEYILKETVEILNKIPAGKRLVAAQSEHAIPVTVIMGRETTYSTQDEAHITLMVAPDYKKNLDLVALTLACALRDIEQVMIGFRRPDRDLDPVEYASMTFSKSLDIIMNMCIIADELKEKLGYSKPLDLVHELGHDDLYKAYKNDLNYDELVEVFIEGNDKALNEGN